MLCHLSYSRGQAHYIPPMGGCQTDKAPTVSSLTRYTTSKPHSARADFGALCQNQ